MVTLKKLAVLFGSSLLVTMVACSGSDQSISDFNKGEGTGTSGGFDKNANGGGGGLGNGKPSAGGDLQACATQTATAEARPVYLVFMFDKSGSMVKNDDGSPSPKWGAAKAAMKTFFEASDSKGISASLTFFPNQKNPSCNAQDYSTPRVTIAALPSATFGQELDAQRVEGGTPTLAALQGAINYAQQVAGGSGKDGKVAVVLVTDGIPEGCSGNSISTVKALAASVADKLPTYVIGVGDQLSSLNEIAAGGGTTSALVVSQTNATQIQADFAKAINQIKASALTCDYKIPAAPAGETFDRSKVNVQHTPAGGAAGTLQYNQACTNGTGWKYDDANNPTRILLCGTSCDGVKAKAGKVDILFGCATQTGPVK